MMDRARGRAACLALLLWAGAPAWAGAESLSGRGAGLYSSERQYRAGDLLTVVISESAQAEQSASTSLSKNADMGYTTGGLLGNMVPSASLGVNSEQKGGGNLSREGKMKAQVGVLVQEILENGNLVVKGRQELKFDSGTQVISVEGVVRPRDVSAQNEVYSYRLANAKIVYSGEGALHEKARTGYLTRILDMLWIF